MGLLGTLLTFPVSGPLLTAKWAVTTIFEEAERQLYDEGAIRQQLEQAERAHRNGEIGEEEFAEREEQLLQRLVDARRWRNEKAKKAGGEP